MRPISSELPWIAVGARGDDDHLGATLELAATITDLDRILVVVAPPDAPRARAELAPYPGVELVVQPRDLDSAPAELLALARVLERDPLGRIVFLPTDPYVADGTLLGAIRAASLGPARARVTLIGATHVATGPITAFWDLVRDLLPLHAAWFERYIEAIGTPDELHALAAAYATMPPADFDRDLLAQATDVAVIASPTVTTRAHAASYSGCNANQWNARYGAAATV